MTEKVDNSIKLNNVPDIVNAINKKHKTMKITTFSRAKAMILKRFFSGNMSIDAITGGGYAYRRIHLLYGMKSSGKNAQMNQMIAYNQRICKHCGGIYLPYFELDHGETFDRWTEVLVYWFGLGPCSCKDNVTQGRVFWILDYERALAVEKPKPMIVKHIINKTTKELVNEDYFNETMTIYNILKEKKELSEEETKQINFIEKWYENIEIKEVEIQKINQTDYMIACGINLEELLVSDPETTDEGIDMVQDMVRSKGCDGIFWDSLQAAIPKYVDGRSAEEATMGVESKLNGLLMRKICGAYAAANLEDETESIKPAMFVSSQVRSELGFMTGPDSYSGGNAIKHHIAIALEFKRNHFLTETGVEAKFEDNYHGQNIRVRAEKNKLAAPGDLYTYDYYFRNGSKYSIGMIDHISEIMNIGIKLGVIQQKGAYYYAAGQTLQGKSKLLALLEQDKEFTRTVYQDISSRM